MLKLHHFSYKSSSLEYRKISSLFVVLLSRGHVHSFTVTVPVACSLFPQRMSMATNKLEKSVQEEIKTKAPSVPDRVYFNKGL